MKENAHSPSASDYCIRARMYLLEGKEFQACRDYMKAIDIDKWVEIFNDIRSYLFTRLNKHMHFYSVGF